MSSRPRFAPVTARRARSAALFVILGVHVLLAGGMAATLSLWGDHEADFYTVARFLVDQGRLPTPADYPAGDAEVRQATQPPLYFLLIAPVIALFDAPEPVPPPAYASPICIGGVDHRPFVPYQPTASYDFPPSGAALTGYLLRGVSLLLSLGAIALVFVTGRALFPQQPGIALGAALLLAVEPTTLLTSITISNDALLLLIAAANTLCIVRFAQTRGGLWAVGMAITSGLALLTRLQGWAIVAVNAAVLVLLVGYWLLAARSAVWPRRRLLGLLLPIAALLAFAGGLALLNLRDFGTIFGRYATLDSAVQTAFRSAETLPLLAVQVFNDTRLDYLSPLRALTDNRAIGLLYQMAAGGLLLLIGVGAIAAIFRRRDRAVYALGAVMIAVTLVMVIFRNALIATGDNTTAYNTAFIFAPLRYYIPILPMIVLLMAAALPLAVPSRWRVPAQIPVIAVALLWIIVAALTGIRLAQSWPTREILTLADIPADAVRPVSSRINSDESIPGLPIVEAYTLTRTADGAYVDAVLYARLPAPTTRSAYAEFALGDQICQTYPAHGLYPTPRWTPDQVVVTRVRVPNCAVPLTDPALTVTWRETGGPLSSPALALGTVSGTVGTSPSCPPNLGTIGTFQASGFRTPPTVAIGEPYIPTINWIVLRQNPALQYRVIIMQHEGDPTLAYTCAATTHLRPPPAWTTGEYVFFDGCPFAFPPDALTGTYRLFAALVEPGDRLVPARLPDGTPAAGNWLPLGTVTVTAAN